MAPALAKIDGQKLNKIAKASGTAETVLTALGLRERLRHFSDIQRTKNYLIRQKCKVVDSDYMKLWKDLQEAGVGVIVYGRKGNADRFQWHYSMKAVANAALTGKDEPVSEQEIKNAKKRDDKVVAAKPVKLTKKQKKEARIATLKAARAAKAAKAAKASVSVPTPVQEAPQVVQETAAQVQGLEKLIYIPLRPDFHLEIRVPANFSKTEADIVAKAMERVSA